MTKLSQHQVRNLRELAQQILDTLGEDMYFPSKESHPKKNPMIRMEHFGGLNPTEAYSILELKKHLVSHWEWPHEMRDGHITTALRRFAEKGLVQRVKQGVYILTSLPDTRPVEARRA